MNHIVEVEQLVKSFNDVKAVDHISFSLTPNKIYGLIGRNGAGKTTIMQLLTAQIFPTSGNIKVFNANPYENQHILNQICFVKESQKYPTVFRINDVLDMAAHIFPNWDKSFATSLLNDFRLPIKRHMSKLSRGMLSSVGIIIGLASRAPLTIFDEPYLGLDAVARSIFYDRLIEDYTEYPRTIILSTHLIDEVSKLLEHILVIDQGKLIIDEETETLRSQAFTVVGNTRKVETFIEHKNVIYREALGNLTSATVSETLSATERKHAEELGLEITPVSLQQLIIHLTRGNVERKVVHV